MPGTGQLWMEQERKAQFSSQCGGIHLQIQPGTFLFTSVASAEWGYDCLSGQISLNKELLSNLSIS